MEKFDKMDAGRTRRENVTGRRDLPVITHAYQTDHGPAAGCPAILITVPPSPPPLPFAFHFPFKLLHDNVRVLQPQGQTPQRQGVRFRAAEGKGRLDRERRIQVVSKGDAGWREGEVMLNQPSFSGFTPQYKGQPLFSAPGISGTLTSAIEQASRASTTSTRYTVHYSPLGCTGFTEFLLQDKGLVILGFPCNQVFFTAARRVRLITTGS